MSDTADQSGIPRAAVHKQILDTAETQTEASMEEIANHVSGATVKLVDRVLEEYGDPGQSQPPAKSTMSQEASYPSPDDLTSEQRETLYAIYEHPEATQRELADRLGVSRTTVNNRANGIDGFDWEDRQTFAEAVFETGSTDTLAIQGSMKSNGVESKATVERLAGRLATLENHVDDITTTETSDDRPPDLELVHKAAHACLKTDTISEEEGLAIMRMLLR
jgi:transcriptional antiterminator